MPSFENSDYGKSTRFLVVPLCEGNPSWGMSSRPRGGWGLGCHCTQVGRCREQPHGPLPEMLNRTLPPLQAPRAPHWEHKGQSNRPNTPVGSHLTDPGQGASEGARRCLFRSRVLSEQGDVRDRQLDATVGPRAKHIC